MRASEAEREEAVDLLRRHASAGRLDTEESDFREHLAIYLAVNALLVAIWALTGAGYLWPVWPFMGWGIAVVLHRVCDPGRERAWGSGSTRAHKRRAIVS